jgi:hypothetical protein
MKDGNLTILYTKEGREVPQPTLHLQSIQSNRALCKSRDTSLCCLAVGRSERRGFLDILPEASLPLAVILLAGNVLLRSEDLLLASKTYDQPLSTRWGAWRASICRPVWLFLLSKESKLASLWLNSQAFPNNTQPHLDFASTPIESVAGKFFHAINNEDTNFDRQERSGLLQHVYAETAAHFAQPHQRKGLDVEQPKLEAVIRISVQVVVCCWTQVSCEAMIDISIYFVYIVLLDDKFFGDFFSGTPQRYPFWNLINGHLCDFVGHYGSFCSFAILRSTFGYFQGCWIETNDFQGFEGLRYVLHFLRRLNCLGGVCAGSLLPAR